MTATMGPLIGKGRQAEIFAWGDGQVVKLFRRGVPATSAEREAEVTRAVHHAGLPVPGVGGVVETDGRDGIVLEHVEGESMWKVGTHKPWKLAWVAGLLADLHVAMHELSVPEFPSLTETLARRIRAVDRLSEEAKAAVLTALHRLPQGGSICHGDFHPMNVLMSPRGPVIIDWSNVTSGDPAADVARTSLMLRTASLPPGAEGHLALQAGRVAFHNLYLRQYLRNRGVSRREVDAWLLPVAAARLAEGISEDEGHVLALIEDLLPG